MINGKDYKNFFVHIEKSCRYRTIWFTDVKSLKVVNRLEFPVGVWKRVLRSALWNAPEEFKQFFTHLERFQSKCRVLFPFGDAALSFINMAELINREDASLAARMAGAWGRLPAAYRLTGAFDYNDVRVIHAQLLGLAEGPAQVYPGYDTLPSMLGLIRAVDCAERAPWSDLQWSWAETPQGTSCIAFQTTDRHDLSASMVISNCRLGHRCGDPAVSPRARKAIDFLADSLPRVLGDRRALECARWEPEGHEVLELSIYLQELRDRVS